MCLAGIPEFSKVETSEMVALGPGLATAIAIVTISMRVKSVPSESESGGNRSESDLDDQK